ncbi:MAG: NADH-quinone oxidoreductase subunit A [Chloroflexi bacterium]|nr:NADH-quinone oxidoreductase subunit A [Chloroflexota bacterium]
MLATYSYIGLFLLVAAVFGSTVLLLSFLLRFVRIRPHSPHPVKASTYESGMVTVGKTWAQFNIRYYLYALLFVIFDVETVFLYPWAVRFKQLGLFGLVEMAIFIAILLVGYAYAWRRGALEW